MNNNKPKVCITLPTFNEAKNIEKIIPNIFKQQEKISSHQLIILIIDGHSQDGTKEKIKFLQKTFPQLHMITEKKRGLGKAYITGFKEAIKQFEPEFLIQMDADGQHDPHMIPLFINLTHYQFDCIIGSRFTTGGKLINFSLKRTLISKIGNLLIRLIGGIPKIQDCTSGFRCIRTSLIKTCSFKYFLTTGYAFQSSLISELVRQKARIMECPITFHERHEGQSKLRLIDQIHFILNLFLIRLNQSSQLIKYALVGLSGIVINVGTYTLLTRLTQTSPKIAIVLAIELSIITNFLCHHFWTFKKKNFKTIPLYKRIANYHLTVLVSALMNLGCFYLLIEKTNINDILANIIGIISGFAINYFFNSKWTWK